MLRPSRKWIILLCCSIVITTGFYNPSRKHDRKYYESRGEIVWDVPTREKLIALTFDDGPNARTTPLILDLLKQYDAKATFFVVGNRIDRFKKIIQREAAEGHEVANHTYNHIYLTRKVQKDTIRNELMATQQKIAAVTGQSSRWFRPPGGLYNETVVKIAKEKGYTVALWSWHQDTRDWSTPGVDKIVSKVLNNAHSGDVVLMHDNVRGSTQTVRALERILPELQKRGFHMVTLSELAEHQIKK
jgi:Predicted xylanase/chitin deacetylase